MYRTLNPGQVPPILYPIMDSGHCIFSNDENDIDIPFILVIKKNKEIVIFFVVEEGLWLESNADIVSTEEESIGDFCLGATRVGG
jgi:hypothetical protein